MFKAMALRIILWLLTEVCLTALELDDLADYGEYVFRGGMVMEMKPGNGRG